MRLTLALVAACLVAGCGEQAAREDGSAPATATVVRRDLVERESFTGALAFADPRSVEAVRTGIVTELPAEGAVVRPGEVLFRIDGQPAILLSGRTPAWRRLGFGVHGQDVAQLERGLAALGFDPGSIDGMWDSSTSTAVRAWRGVSVLELGDVVFLSGARRLAARRVGLGGHVGPGMPVLDTTSTARRVVVLVPADRQQLFVSGRGARVLLPAGSRSARIVAVGRVARRGEDGEVRVSVELSLGGRPVRGLDQAPVEVRVEARRRRDVRAVPVTALLALAEGGYAVEVAESGTTRLVRVDPGFYADGLVEIEGAVREGQRVVVPE